MLLIFLKEYLPELSNEKDYLEEIIHLMRDEGMLGESFDRNRISI